MNKYGIFAPRIPCSPYVLRTTSCALCLGTGPVVIKFGSIAKSFIFTIGEGRNDFWRLNPLYEEGLMRKFLLLWYLDSAKVPFTLRRSTRSALMAQVRQDVKKGVSRELGSFVDNTSGYIVAEGTETEVGKIVKRYMPFVSFQIHPIVSVS